MPDLWDNPMGTDGFEVVEYAAPDPGLLRRLFARAEPDQNEINILRGILASLDPATGREHSS